MTKNPSEVELKFDLTSAEIAKIKKSAFYRSQGEGRASTKTLVSTYFDDPNRSLERDGIALRVRRIGSRYIQTLKTDPDPAVGLFERTELEADVGGHEPDVSALPEGPLADKVAKVMGEAGLIPVLETEIRRTSKTVRTSQGSLVRLDMDEGTVRVGEAHLPICEVELELVDGDLPALFEVSESLWNAGVKPCLSLETKAAKGQRLALGGQFHPVKADKSKIPTGVTVEAALSLILQSCIRQILMNEGAVRQGTDPEGVHQMRVGVRRLRSAFSIFKKVLPPDQIAPLKDDFKWLFQALGAVRDMDVFATETLLAMEGRLEAQDGFGRLKQTVEDVRSQGYADLRQVLDDPRFQKVMLGLVAWTSLRQWRGQEVSEKSVLLFDPIEAFAADYLAKLDGKVRRQGKNLAALPIEQRHDLRLEVKKLRYAVDFLAELFPKKKVKPYLKPLMQLQETLGRLNDGANAASVLGRLATKMGAKMTVQDSKITGYVQGWIEHQAEVELQTLEAHWESFSHVKRFW